MESEKDDITLLKAISDLKQRIDDLTDECHENIDISEIKSIRNVIEHFFQKYESHSECNTNQSSQLLIINVSRDENSKKSKTKVHTFDNLSCCDVINAIRENSNNNTERKLNDNTDNCREVTDEGNTNKRQQNVHKNCEMQLEFFKKYVSEIECRLKGFEQFMLHEKVPNDCQKTREVRFAAALKQLKDNESCYRAKVQKLSDELERVRRRSNERRKRVSSQIERMKSMAEKHAAESAEMAEMLLSVAVDFSPSDRKSTVAAALEGGNKNSSQDKGDDNDDDVSCLTRERLAGSQSFSRGPSACSTPRRAVDHNRSCPCSSMATTIGIDCGTTDNEDYIYCDDLSDAAGREKDRSAEESDGSQWWRRPSSSKLFFEKLDNVGSMETVVHEFTERQMHRPRGASESTSDSDCY